jgi:predicted lysophospholipase L1 biosynthesis ABC-type transport system permease subunit
VRTTAGRALRPGSPAPAPRRRRGEPAISPWFDVATSTQQHRRSLARERAITRLTGFFGVLALLLAAVGLYGVMSYGVARRTGEIGLRMALGAPRAQVLALVLRQTAQMVALGVAAGLLAALAVTRVAASQLFGVGANDPLTFAVATAGDGGGRPLRRLPARPPRRRHRPDDRAAPRLGAVGRAAKAGGGR